MSGAPTNSYEEDQILTRWQAGLTRVEISAATGISKRRIRYVIEEKARPAGDPRASNHYETERSGSLDPDSEGYVKRMIRMDRAFCEAMKDAMRAGLENPWIGAGKATTEDFRPVQYNGQITRSMTGSQGAWCTTN